MTAALVTGFLGGIGFAAASMLKLVELTSGYETNWHSILEQTTGLFNGLALTVAMLPLARRAPAPRETFPARRWTEVFAVGFVLVLITYLNVRKNPILWIQSHAWPATMHGIPTGGWFNLAYLLLAAAILAPLACHLRRPLPLIPDSALGRGQWLYLAFLWWMIAGNFERELIGFTERRLVTEGVIHVNACLCTLLILLVPGRARAETIPAPVSLRRRLGRDVVLGLLAAILAILMDWGIVRAVYGDRFAGHAGLHIRFGPNATTRAKPSSR
jgi:hypothetical protein